MAWVSEQKLMNQFFSKMYQEGCGGIVLTKKWSKNLILGIYIKNHRISSHTENFNTNFFHGLGQWIKVNESIFFKCIRKAVEVVYCPKKEEKSKLGNTHMENYRINDHTENWTPNFIPGLGQWTENNEPIFF